MQHLFVNHWLNLVFTSRIPSFEQSDRDLYLAIFYPCCASNSVCSCGIWHVCLRCEATFRAVPALFWAEWSRQRMPQPRCRALSTPLRSRRPRPPPTPAWPALREALPPGAPLLCPQVRICGYPKTFPRLALLKRRDIPGFVHAIWRKNRFCMENEEYVKKVRKREDEIKIKMINVIYMKK